MILHRISMLRKSYMKPTSCFAVDRQCFHHWAGQQLIPTNRVETQPCLDLQFHLQAVLSLFQIPYATHGAGIWIPTFTPLLWPSFVGFYIPAPWWANLGIVVSSSIHLQFLALQQLYNWICSHIASTHPYQIHQTPTNWTWNAADIELCHPTVPEKKPPMKNKSPTQKELEFELYFTLIFTSSHCYFFQNLQSGHPRIYTGSWTGCQVCSQHIPGFAGGHPVLVSYHHMGVS